MALALAVRYRWSMACTSAPRTGSSASVLRGALVGYSRKTGFRGWNGFGWQIVLLVPPSLLYFLVRDLSAGQEREAFANAAAIVNFEQAIGLDWEAALQQRILDTGWIVDLMNWVYIYGHFPLIAVSLVLLFGLSRPEFLTLRNALVASGAIGLVCFALYPVAPPRLFAPGEFFDSVAELSGSYQILQNPKVTNQFAAVPSFHVGWNLLVAFALWRASRFALLRLIAVVFPMLMIASVLLTANHWVVDIVAGAVVALLGIGGAKLMDRFFRHLNAMPDSSSPAPPALRPRERLIAADTPGAGYESVNALS